jgi:cell filamentation protein
VFDPFGDFAHAGYLRNTQGSTDLDLVKRAEHELFRTKLPEALKYLEGKRPIQYEHFLQVHQILFGALYPWAGRDRHEVLPRSAIYKGDTKFSHPADCAKAVQFALREAQEDRHSKMRGRPGYIMGLFAFGHPFLDGNGRTMLVVHTELCYRAGLSIAWQETAKQDYLSALTREIADPNAGHLDAYLKPFQRGRMDRTEWFRSFEAVRGLDGLDAESNEAADYSNPHVSQAYEAFDKARGLQLPEFRYVEDSGSDVVEEVALPRPRLSA